MSICDGEFEQFQPRRTLFGGIIGLVGLSTVGRYLLPLLEPFGATVHLYDTYVSPVEIAEYNFVEKSALGGAFEGADVVSIHVSRTPETIAMIGSDELATIPNGALLINTARADIINKDALYTELSSGRFHGAIDVYHEHPLLEDDPLRDLKNVQLTTHLGGHGPHSWFGTAMVDEIERYFDGRALQYEIPPEQAELMTQ